MWESEPEQSSKSTCTGARHSTSFLTQIPLLRQYFLQIQKNYYYYLVKLKVGYHPVAVVLQLYYSVHHTTTNNKEENTYKKKTLIKKENITKY
jgi:hypothetical protein